jgi:hypothetical protein
MYESIMLAYRPIHFTKSEHKIKPKVHVYHISLLVKEPLIVGSFFKHVITI